MLWCRGFVLLASLLAYGESARGADALLDVDQPLVTHSLPDQKLATQTALQRVLVRVSGRRDLGSSPGMGRAMSEAHRYASQMSFATTPTGEVLRLHFERASVESLLRSVGLPVWPSAHRPTLVLWLLADAPRRGIIGRNSSDPLLAALRAEAKERGLPVVVPVGDAGEADIVTAAALDARVFAPVAKASSRYGSQVALVGRIRSGVGKQSGLDAGLTKLSGQWWLVDPFALQNVSLPATSVEEQATAAIEWAIRRVSSPANARTASGPLMNYPITVSGVNSFQDYAGVLNTIKNLEVVNFVDVTEFSGDELSLRVRTRLPFATLARGVAAARGLTVVTSESTGSVGSATGETDAAQTATIALTSSAQAIHLQWGQGE